MISLYEKQIFLSLFIATPCEPVGGAHYHFDHSPIFMKTRNFASASSARETSWAICPTKRINTE